MFTKTTTCNIIILNSWEITLCKINALSPVVQPNLSCGLVVVHSNSVPLRCASKPLACQCPGYQFDKLLSNCNSIYFFYSASHSYDTTYLQNYCSFLQGEHIDYHGDPLSDFTLMRFLDRFICKNPKQKKSDHGGSIMQRTTRLTEDPTKEILG